MADRFEEVDMSDDDFKVYVTRRYDDDKFAGVTVFVQDRETGRWTNPYIAARDVNIVGEVIRDRKERLKKTVEEES